MAGVGDGGYRIIIHLPLLCCSMFTKMNKHWQAKSNINSVPMKKKSWYQQRVQLLKGVVLHCRWLLPLMNTEHEHGSNNGLMEEKMVKIVPAKNNNIMFCMVKMNAMIIQLTTNWCCFQATGVNFSKLLLNRFRVLKFMFQSM